MTSKLGSEDRPLRVAIVGSGPSGFFTADALFKQKIPVKVDMFDRLPTPYGLLRGGVAPDHQRMKSLERFFERVATQNPGFSFWGNVQIGQDLTVEDIRACFDAVIFATGAETDKRLNIPGSELKGIHTATQFVGWYNGHPDYQDLSFDLTADSAAIIGQGNVAIDVARILAKTENELKASDITAHALSCLVQSKLKKIHLIGRRGPVQAAFTELEIKELGELEAVDVVINPDDLNLNEIDQKELDLPENNKARKNLNILNEIAHRPLKGHDKQIIIHFYRSPSAFEGEDLLTGLLLNHTTLSGEPGRQKATVTNQQTRLDCELVFQSIGYRGIPVEGVPFDSDHNIIPNDSGRVLDADKCPVPGLYVVGWIKRGPQGVLGTNKPDGAETVSKLMADLSTLKPALQEPQWLDDKLLQNNIQRVTFSDWSKLNQIEVERGRQVGKPREKITSVSEMLAAVKGG